MQMSATAVPVVLCMGGHDPTGGAGLQADIEAVTAQGCHPVTLPTCLTVQNTHDVVDLAPLDGELMTRQAQVLLEDIRPTTVKIGLVGSLAAVAAIEAILPLLRGVPLVIDPVLAAGGGLDLASAALTDALHERLVPRADLLTPNLAEARRLTGCDDPERAVAVLLHGGCRAVLLTTADDPGGALVSNHLYIADAAPQTFSWPRVAGSFHGSGCTLAAACAARLALGEPLVDACRRAQSYTWQTLAAAHRPGSGQALPGRIARPG